MVWNLGSIVVNGALRLGSPTCRLQSHITFLFHTVNGLSTFSFGIRVPPGGNLSMHGALYTPTWTRVSQSVATGATKIVLQVPARGRLVPGS